MFSSALLSQNGTVRGMIYDDTSGETILFGNVQVEETGIGTTSDLDGAYSIELEPGSYTLIFSYLGFSDLKVSGVVVTPGEITGLDIRLQEESEMIDEVVITARQVRNTEAALSTIRKKSTNVLDGISAASFKRIGDSNAASAVKRVPGVSIEGGKYVYVRGLGDRYTKSILNGIDIPGLDPDRNTLQMDIFPTNVIDNIIVLKTFTADLPADFTGGVVNINTKDFPEQLSTSISAGIGYNPDMNLNDQYLKVDGSSTDWLGYDDGSRKIPTQKSSDVPTRNDVFGSRIQEARFSSILSRFDPTLAGYRTSSPLNYSLGFSTGNQFNKKGLTIGYNFAGTYKNDTDFYQDAVNTRYGKGNTSDIFDLDLRESQIGDIGSNNILLGGLAGLALKSKTSKITLNGLHLQNGESKVGYFKYIGSDQGSNFTADQYNIEYSERSISNVLLNGQHSLQDGELNINWKLSPTFSRITDPDIRFTRVRTDGDELSIGTESGVPQRIWRYLNEVNLAGKLDIDKNYGFNDQKATVKVGGGYTYKQRDYEIQSFAIFPGETEITSSPNDLFQENNFFNRDNFTGLYYGPQFIPNNVNKYDANVRSIAGYISNEFAPIDKLKAVIGLRFESYVQRYSGINQSNDRFDNITVLDDANFFPTLNLIYGLTENANLRGSFTRTIARPSFKEASFATIIDPISGRTFIGGFFPDIDVSTGEQIWDGQLQSTNITNLDLRYEFFQTGGQNISLSTFYKGFADPIEIVQYVQAPNNFQPRNVGDGQVLGVELEFRKNLGTLESSNFALNGNVTLTKSNIEMSETEFRSRLANARDGEEIDNKRDMAGQAPYIINGGVSYSNSSRSLDLGMFYNVQGRTLQFVGIADRPDIYTRPFHSLNFTANYTFGPTDNIKFGLKADNLLGSKRESVFESFNTENQLFTSLAPQRTFSLSLSYKL
jgi:outer membrane receptor for ferrienterochelin and colicin